MDTVVMGGRVALDRVQTQDGRDGWIGPVCVRILTSVAQM